VRAKKKGVKMKLHFSKAVGKFVPGTALSRDTPEELHPSIFRDRCMD
jgi:hypothetical protein